MHAKEIIKNKADKMVDLIIDEIGEEGNKNISTSFIDKKSRVKYVIDIKIASGAPESLSEQGDVSEQIEELSNRISVIESKEDQDTVYDDSGVKARLTVLEGKVDALENNS